MVKNVQKLPGIRDGMTEIARAQGLVASTVGQLRFYKRIKTTVLSNNTTNLHLDKVDVKR